MRRPIALSAVIVLLVASPATAAPIWVVVPSPDQSPYVNVLTDVDATGPSDAWATGHGLAAPRTDPRTLLMRWDGRAWRLVDHPRPAGNSTLTGVDALTATDAWAVGYSGATPQTRGTTLALRWDGSRWSVVPSPRPGVSSALYAVKAFGPRQAWTVGTVSTSNTGYRDELLTARWDGAGWRTVPTPVPASAFAVLEAVDGLAVDDAWSVGWTLDTPFGGAYRPIALHWTGGRWQATQIPVTRLTARLTGVLTLAPDDVWAVGSGLVRNASHWSPLVMHWNGRSWTEVPTPVAAGDLTDVVALSARAVYAVGQTTLGAERTLVLRFDGASWTVVPTPSPNATARLNGAAAVSPGTVWAVGDSITSDGIRHTLTLRGTTG